MNWEHVKQTGIAAASKSAGILRAKIGCIDDIQKKGCIDLVTEADTESEKIIIDTILSRFPEHSILAEESGATKGNDNFQWIIDPLDGTTNFAHELPLFSTSIAFAAHGEIKVGIVNNPINGELFTAVEGKGAFLNGRPITVTDRQNLSECLLVTGFPYNFKEILNDLMIRFSNCLDASQGVRRLGSAALDLCYVACGRFDGFWEQNLNPWDTAAAYLIAREAGATITDFSNNPFDIDMKEILATNKNIHGEMLSLLKL